MARSRQTRARSWLGPLAVGAAVVGLATAAMATAPFATGSGKALSASAQPNNKPKPPPQPPPPPPEETPPPPPEPPPPPPDPLAPAAPPNLDRAKLKEPAKKILPDVLSAAVLLCAIAEDPDPKPDPHLGMREDRNGERQLCRVAVVILLFAQKIARDPPDPNFMQVTLPSPTPVRSVARCSKQVARRDCVRLRAALLRYRNALATTAAAATGTGTSLERFSGAEQAGSAAGVMLQAAATKAYAGELAAALGAQQAAARALAATLRKARLDVRLDARALQSFVRKLGSPNGLPASTVAQLVAAGATSGAAELAQTLKSALVGLPKTLSLTRALGAAPSTAALREVYRTLTVYELAALVRGLADQGAVSATTGEALLNDLRQWVTAATPEARTPALTQFLNDARSQVTGPAAQLLTVAGSALTG